MSLDEVPVIVSEITVEETSLVVQIAEPPPLSAVDVTVGDPTAIILVDIPDGPGGVITVEETGFVIDVVTPPVALAAIDIEIGDPAATIVVDIPGDFDDEVIGGKITIGTTPPASPGVNDVWIDTEGVGGGGVSGGAASPDIAARVMANGLVIPYYLYPDNPYTDANVQLLLDLMRTYHDVPVLVVVNPANGPGTIMDGNWSAFIRMVQAAGGKVCGYVSTVYATRAEADVKADIDLWLSVYSTSRIDGIFLDEQTWETGPGNVGLDYVDLYKRYTDYCHAAGLSPVIANPGTNQQGAYFATWTADIILVHEQTTWPSEATMEGNFVGGHADYSYTRRGALIYNQATLDAGELATLRKNVQWVYVTDDNLTAGVLNPWDSLPTYLDALFAALSE